MKKLILISSVATFLLSSCISQKKYDQLSLSHQRLQQDSVEFVNQVNTLNSTLAECEDTVAAVSERAEAERLVWQTEKDVLLAQINLQGDEIDEKSEALRQRAERLQELQARLDEQTQATQALRKAVSDALVNFSSDELQVSIENGLVKVSLSENLLFPSASVNLDPKGIDALGKLAVVLKNNPDVNINIVGFTDSLSIRTARFRNNWDLSVLRATTIASILQEKYDVDGSRLTASGQAEFIPVASNTTEEGRALNRRTEIFLSPKLDALLDAVGTQSQPGAGD